MSVINLLFSNNYIATPIILSIRFCRLLPSHFYNNFSCEAFPTLFSFGSLSENPASGNDLFHTVKACNIHVSLLLLKQTLN